MPSFLGRQFHRSALYTLKVNVMAWLEFELAECDVTVQYISHYATKAPHFLLAQLPGAVDYTDCTSAEG